MQNESEKMILNNYLAMKKIEEDYKNQKLSLDLILEIHGFVTNNLLDSNEEKPKLRKNNEEIFIKDSIAGEIYHAGPKPEFVKKSPRSC